ncbi:ABC transporter ATP-binding protein, partial [Chondromyces apiculatus]|uniref:ABC transporter ATP-binding protein n=1 Tax=Chondromyces apiculatus TaxID=51 RepID=UPI001E3D9887
MSPPADSTPPSSVKSTKRSRDLSDTASDDAQHDEPVPSVGRARRERPILHAEKLSKLYPVRRGLFGKTQFVHAVEGVTFYVRKGETFGLVGESGCGKSTLGRTVLRLVEPTLGRVMFDGRDLTTMTESELRKTRRRMQLIFQDPYGSLNPRMTVREIVGEGLTIHRLAANPSDADAQVADVLQKVGLRPDLMDRFPHELSGGMRQRVGIARALAVRPDFIVCDEPVSALDLSVQAQIINLLEALQDELGVSYLFISHDLRVIQYVSHRMAVMVLGRIVEMGPTQDVSERRYHPYTRALFAAMPTLAAAEGPRPPVTLAAPGAPALPAAPGAP